MGTIEENLKETETELENDIKTNLETETEIETVVEVTPGLDEQCLAEVRFTNYLLANILSFIFFFIVLYFSKNILFAINRFVKSIFNSIFKF